MRRRWSINGRFVTQPITGVQRYAHEILRGLDHLLSRDHPLARDLNLELLIPPGRTTPPDLRFIQTRSVGRVSGHLWEQIELPRRARNGLISLCNTGPLAARKHIVCIHDVNTRAFSQSYSLPFRTLYRMLLPALGHVASVVATVSHHSAKELARHDLCRRDKVVVIPDGHEHACRWTPKHSAATKAAAGPNTIVVIGSTALHKNVGLIVGMSSRLERVGLRVAVAGLGNPRVFSTDGMGSRAGNVTWLGRLSDDQIAALLRDSLCLAFPSLAEGFGLPPLEAMTWECPVVASNSASVPEICADAALYASPTNPDDWLKSFLRLREDRDLRAQLIRRGRARAPLFSWRRSAELYLRAMARVDGIHVQDSGLMQDRPTLETSG